MKKMLTSSKRLEECQLNLMENVTYDTIKSHKKCRASVSFFKTHFWEIRRGRGWGEKKVRLAPQPFKC